jgi:type IV secretion system protein TrbB
MGDPGKSSTREEQTRRLAESMKRQLGAFCGLLHESDVVELMLNADGTVWVDRLGQPMRAAGTMPPAMAESFIATVASTLRGTVTRENPILECELPLDGSRFEALIPPVVSAPVFTIRRKASAVFTLREYERQEIMTTRQRGAIETAVAQRQNILVVGGTGSGKTTLANGIIDHMVQASPGHRLVIIEDTGEIQCAAKNAVVMRATDTVDMQRLLKATMRLRPDRIIVGEVRGGEALSPTPATASTFATSWSTTSTSP